MAIKKAGLFFCILVILILSSSFVFSADLEVKKKEISAYAVKDLNIPAVFELEITNQDVSDKFTIYTTVGLEIMPNETFTLSEGETKTITVKIYPTVPLKISPDTISFEYKIKGEKTGIFTDDLAIGISYLKDAFNFYIDNISPESEKAVIHFENKAGYKYSSLELKIDSIFFSKDLNFTLDKFEKKAIEAPINQDKLKESFAGPYIVNAEILTEGKKVTTSTILTFLEKSGIETKENKERTLLLLLRQEIEKINRGNTKNSAEIVLSKDIFSSLITSFNVKPVRREMNGLKFSYIFQEELSPGESLKVISKTNWWILVLIILVIVVGYNFINRYIKSKLVIRKNVSFLRTKGGEFALRVTLHLKARDNIERVKLFDRLPPMVKVFEKFGLDAPDKLDEGKRSLEWNFAGLARGEERILSYIIYSKVGIVGRFELPRAGAVYEYEGRLKESQSNDAFYSNP